MSLIERIYQVSDFKNDSIYKISKEIGVSNGYFSKTRQKKGSVSSNIIEKIVNYYPDLNVEWLITGKGEMLKETKMQINSNCNSDNNLNNNISGTNIKGDVVVSHNDISKLIELQRGSQEIQKELNKRLEASQNQIDTLLEILKSK